MPLWLIAVALGGGVLTAYLGVLLAARFFRTDTLLSAAPLSWQRFWREWRPAQGASRWIRAILRTAGITKGASSGTAN